MTIQSSILLHKIKKAQRSIDEFVYIDRDNMCVFTVVEAERPSKKVDITSYKTSIESTLEYLVGEKMIKRMDSISECFQVTQQGWYIWKTRWKKLLRWAFSSIVIPIIVSAITAMITIWISMYFNNPGHP